jgi:hypothetical protein
MDILDKYYKYNYKIKSKVDYCNAIHEALNWMSKLDRKNIMDYKKYNMIILIAITNLKYLIGDKTRNSSVFYIALLDKIYEMENNHNYIFGYYPDKDLINHYFEILLHKSINTNYQEDLDSLLKFYNKYNELKKRQKTLEDLESTDNEKKELDEITDEIMINKDNINILLKTVYKRLKIIDI